MKEGRLRLLHAVGVQLEPIFLLYDAEQPFAVPDRAPDVELDGNAPLAARGRRPSPRAFADTQLLIADGHHRYETALAYHEARGHRGERADARRARLDARPRADDLPDAPRVRRRDAARGQRLRRGAGAGARRSSARSRTRTRPSSRSRPAARRVVTGDRGLLDVELVDRLGHAGIAYTPEWREAVRRVRDGEANVAYLLRPTRIEDVFAVAARGEVLPQKTTYFYPKLVSGPPLPPRVSPWLELCRGAVGDIRGVLAELPGRAEREPVVGAGEGGDDTTAIDAAVEAVVVERLRASGESFTLVSEELGIERVGSGGRTARSSCSTRSTAR